MLNFMVRNNKVLAEVLEKEEKTLASGIVLTGSAVDKVMEDIRRARVLKSDIPDIKEGDVIVYLRFVGTPLNDGKMIVLDDSDIFGIEI